MKDATGELSMTAVAVVAIAGIAALFSAIIWPTIRTNIMRNTYCSQAQCDYSSASGNYVSCTYCKDEECNDTGTISCPNDSTD